MPFVYFGSVQKKIVGSVLRIIYTRDCTLKLCAIVIKKKKFINHTLGATVAVSFVDSVQILWAIT